MHYLQQYPDAQLYKAAAKLKPEDRPDVPVRLYSKDFFSRGALKDRKIEGAVNMVDNTISVNKDGMVYKGKNPFLLGGVLAHEMEHMRNLRKNQLDFSEYGPYMRQHAALKRMGYNDGKYLEAVLQRAKQHEMVGTSGRK